MRRATRIAWVITSLALMAAQGPSGTSAEWQDVADGVSFRIFNLSGPNLAYVVQMDRANPHVTLDTAIADGRITEGKETVSQMAERYDETLGSWEPAWGSRDQVVAVINGSFHNEETGSPLSGMVQSGWYLKRFDDLGGGSGFAWKLDRTAFIGGCVNHPAANQLVTYLDSGNQQTIDGIDDRRQSNELVVYTPAYDVQTHTPDSGVEVVVELDQPFTILSYPQMVHGVVRAVHVDQGDTPIPFDSVVLSAGGRAGKTLLENAKVGARVGLSTSIDHFKADCRTPDKDSWSETYASLSGSFVFLQDGEIQSFVDPGATTPSPRTAICFNDEVIDFVVVDGRDNQHSIGMTIDGLAHFCKDRLDARWGINQDGGGSSTLWLNGKVVNHPSDGRQRAVANGLMMVEVKPPEFSTTYRPGDTVLAQDLLDFRVGPGDNYRGAGDLPAGSTVTVAHNANGLDGVLATGQHWWEVEDQGRLGWVPENALELVTAALPSPTPGAPAQTGSQDPVQALISRASWIWAQTPWLYPGRP